MKTPQLNLRDGWNRMNRSHVLLSGLIGAVVGGLGWLLALLLQQTVIESLLCRSTDSFGACAQGGTYAWWFAMGLLALAGLFVMVNRGIYRPLLVVMAAFASVWGIWAWLGYLEWWQAVLWQSVLLGLAYGLYTLIARISNFGFSLGAMVVAILVVRAVSMLA